MQGRLAYTHPRTLTLCLHRLFPRLLFPIAHDESWPKLLNILNGFLKDQSQAVIRGKREVLGFVPDPWQPLLHDTKQYDSCDFPLWYGTVLSPPSHLLLNSIYLIHNLSGIQINHFTLVGDAFSFFLPFPVLLNKQFIQKWKVSHHICILFSKVICCYLFFSAIEKGRFWRLFRLTFSMPQLFLVTKAVKLQKWGGGHNLIIKTLNLL